MMPPRDYPFRRLFSVLSRRAELLGAAWIVALAAVLWLVTTPEAFLRDDLRRWQFWSLEATFALLLYLSARSLPTLLRSLNLQRRDLHIPIIASLLAVTLAGLVAPRTNRIYYDEHIYQSVGQNLSDMRLAQMCNDGNVEYGILQCWRGEYNKEPYGYPYLLSVFYRLGGVHETTAFRVNAISAAVLVWVVFLLTTALTEQPEAGAYASVVAGLIPEQLRWSHSAAAEPTAALACACALLATASFVRLRTTSMLLWTVAAGAFAVQFRPECVLIVPVIVFMVIVYAPAEFRQRRIWYAGALAIGILALHLGHLVAVRNEGWGAVAAKMSTAYLAPNLSTNGWFYISDARFPVIYTFLAVVSFFSRRTYRAVAVAAFYFLLFWGIFLFFYAGSYNFGADDRFSLMAYPPLAVLAGIGTWRLAEAFNRTGSLSTTRRYAATVCIAFQFLWYMPMVRSVGEEAWGARADVEFARAIARDLPKNSFVLTQNPGMFHLWGVSAAQASIAMTEPDYARNVLMQRYAGGVYFHWNFWCNVADPLQQSFCNGVLRRFPSTLVRESRERDYRYALYRLDPSGTVPPTR